MSLLLSSHPLPVTAMTAGMTLCAALSGRPPREVLLVAATVLTGQLTIGWTNDVVDSERDRLAGRTDKPVAAGWVSPRTVLVATGVATALLVPLSLANGTPAGIAHLVFVFSAWLYNVPLKRTPLSWLPYVVSFGLLPAFLSYGGLGLGVHGAPPTVPITLCAAALGAGIHVLNVLPDLPEDRASGARHLPLLVADRLGVPPLRTFGVLCTGLSTLGVLISALSVGLRSR